MPFSNFTNPYQNPLHVPAKYRTHPSLENLFRLDGSGRYRRPAEDPVTMWAIALLHEEYGVPLEAMGLELFANFDEGTHQSGRRYQGRADLAIYDDRYVDAVGSLDVACIMVEAMEPSKRGEAIVLRPDVEKVDSVFLHALLLSQLTMDQVVPLQSGTSLPRVSASDILGVNLPISSDKTKQKMIGAEISRRRAEARRLRVEAERIVTEAKARVERMILGEEVVA